MPNKFVLWLEENSVRFTPNGDIAVVDAIEALSGFDNAGAIWEALKDENPEILLDCKQYYFSKNKAVMVADGKGWKQIEDLLFDYILDQNEALP